MKSWLKLQYCHIYKNMKQLSFFILCRFALNKDWNKRIIFILNLAVCDLMYCIFCLPSYATLYLGGTWFLGEKWCLISVVLAFISASASWMALALIALSGALLVAYPSISEMVFSRTKSRLIILSSWLIVLLMYCPIYAEVIRTTNNYSQCGISEFINWQILVINFNL